MSRSKQLFSLVATVLLLLALPLAAQEQTASISGNVTDASGAALPGVTVEATSPNLVGTATAVTDTRGRYRFPSLPPGVYKISASLDGFQNASVPNVRLALGNSPNVDMTMQVGEVAEAIVVTGEAPLVDTTRSATTTAIRGEALNKLPKGRDFTSVISQASGASVDKRAGGVSIEGASGAENRYVIDGVDTTDPQRGLSGKMMVTDFVEEVQVKSAGYNAEFGGAVGGVINVITKTGSNEFQGDLGAYYSDDSFSGHSSSAVGEDLTQCVGQCGAGDRPQLQVTDGVSEHVNYPEDEFEMIEPGFSLGGPIVRDRLWFFLAYQPSMYESSRTLTEGAGAGTTFNRSIDRQFGTANVNGNIGSKLLYKIAANYSPYEIEGLFPNRNGRDYNPEAIYSQGVEQDNESFSGYADFVATNSLVFGLRGGKFSFNTVDTNIPNVYRYLFPANRPAPGTVFPEMPASLQRNNGFQSVISNRARVQDEFSRENVALDASLFVTALGEHAFKAGWQYEKLGNSVLDTELQPRVTFEWNAARPNGGRGQYGYFTVRQFATIGEVESDNTAFFLQDSWTTFNDRLTLNIGARAEQEIVPSYREGMPNPIEFDFEDKFAPRLGFALDVLGNGRSKAYGSYGRFFDITKLSLARGSFGGDKWVDFHYELNTFNWNTITCTGLAYDVAARPDCGGQTFIQAVDRRFYDPEAIQSEIDPDLKPMESEETTLGFQQELTPTTSIGLRWTHKELITTIEDIGVLVDDGEGGVVEHYYYGNPGEGLSVNLESLDPRFPKFPKPVRKYDGYELEFTSRQFQNLSLHATYLYSRQWGNYTGLATSDEVSNVTGVARQDPNVSRAYDNLTNSFDENGQPVYGLLPTDRPHQFKAQLVYDFPFGTTIGFNQYVGSGTPINKMVAGFEGNLFLPEGRGTLGRTPTLTQSDLYLAHQISLGGMGLEFSLNVLNLFDEDTPTNYFQVYNVDEIHFAGDDTGAQLESFFGGFDHEALLDAQGAELESRFNQPNFYQEPRAVRLGVKFRF